MVAIERLQPADFPQSSVGAPLPHVFADEHRLLIAYIMELSDRAESLNELCAIVTVERYKAVQFGPPNDEAIGGHRLHDLGLAPYSSFEVLNSKWIADLERANQVHANHRPELYADYRHFILTFHDSTVEFIAKKFAVRQFQGSIRGAILDALKC